MLLDCRYGCRSCPPSFEPAESYSGKSQLRAPKSLHRRLAERAKREGVSLNTLAVTLIFYLHNANTQIFAVAQSVLLNASECQARVADR
jgi:hypothetical protein